MPSLRAFLTTDHGSSSGYSPSWRQESMCSLYFSSSTMRLYVVCRAFWKRNEYTFAVGLTSTYLLSAELLDDEGDPRVYEFATWSASERGPSTLAGTPAIRQPSPE